MKKSNGGFTLLEVMIALTIFALIATTLSKAASTSVDTQIHLERKLLATWIAENEIIEMRSTPAGNVRNKSKNLEFADRKWVINQKVSPYKSKTQVSIPLEIKQVDISVSLEETPDYPLQTLTTYIAND